MKPFLTNSPPTSSLKWDGGYKGGTISPKTLSDDLFGEDIQGPWLTCYMLRRFGWPNVGSDDYKELMTWALTTPIKGLYLSVTPYLGGSNLHFGILFTNAVERKIDHDIGRETWFKRYHKFIMNWWEKHGSKLYMWGYGLREDDPDELVHKFSDDSKNERKCWGLWRITKTTPAARRKGFLPKNIMMADWWLGKLLEQHHPEIRQPNMTKRERSRRSNSFRRQCETAIKRTMLDLLRETHVRDINFNVFGDIEHSYAKKVQRTVAPAAGYWTGFGNTPEYWYSKECKKERAAALRKERK